MPPAELGVIVWLGVVPAALAACWTDYRAHRVPNWLNAAAALGGLGAQWTLCGWAGLSAGLLGMAVGFGSLVVLWLLRGMGAGDVKFMAALGAWLGPQMTLHAVIAGILVGGVMAVGLIAYHRAWAAAGVNLGVLMTRMSRWDTAFGGDEASAPLGRSSSMMPYAIPLSLGVVIALMSDYAGWWVVL